VCCSGTLVTGDTPWTVVERREGLLVPVWICDIYHRRPEGPRAPPQRPSVDTGPDACARPGACRGRPAAAAGRRTHRCQSHDYRTVGRPLPAAGRRRHARPHPAARIAAPTGHRRASRRRCSPCAGRTASAHSAWPPAPASHRPPHTASWSATDCRPWRHATGATGEPIRRLRAPTPQRPGQHRRQETRPHPPDGGRAQMPRGMPRAVLTGTATAAATSIRTPRWTTTPARPPAPRAWPMRVRPPAPGSRSAPRNSKTTGAPPAPDEHLRLDSALASPDQRQGRTLPPHPAQKVGLPPALRLKKNGRPPSATGSIGTTATDPTPASRPGPQPTASPTCPNSRGARRLCGSVAPLPPSASGQGRRPPAPDVTAPPTPQRHRPARVTTWQRPPLSRARTTGPWAPATTRKITAETYGSTCLETWPKAVR